MIAINRQQLVGTSGKKHPLLLSDAPLTFMLHGRISSPNSNSRLWLLDAHFLSLPSPICLVEGK